MSPENVRYLIIPDVHGRTFWRHMVEECLKNHPHIKIIFLGDYLDPYQYEGITQEDAIEVFDEIIELKHQYPDRIILLLGNHDLHYVMNDRRGCRMDYRNKGRIVDTFRKEFDNFDLCWFDEIAGKNIIFSHAGFTRGWLNHRMKWINPEMLDRYTSNEIYYSIDYRMIKETDWKDLLKRSHIFSDVSYYRGGDDSFSSFLWTDVNEMIEAADPINAMQIFGHSQQEKDPVKYKDFYCLDCRKPFLLTDDVAVRTEYYLALDDNTAEIDERMKKKAESLSKYTGFFM